MKTLLFNAEKSRASLRTEVLGGVTTFATMAYIIFVQPVVLGAAGVLYPITSPALIVVGSIMLGAVRDLDWDDFTESFPAFLTIVMMPLTFNITDGIAFGFIAYALLKLATGRSREAHWLVYLFAALFLLRYAIAGH